MGENFDPDGGHSGGGADKTRRSGGKRRGARFLRRCAQGLSLGLFLLLLAVTVSPLPWTPLPVDLYLRLDPLAAVIVPLAAREWISALWPGIGMLLLALIAGRIFCGYICPMGITLDMANGLGRKLLGKPGRAAGIPPRPSGPVPSYRRLRQVKYLLLAVLAGAALLGVNLCFWAAPITLITRFYALLAHPFALLAGNEALLLAQPVLDVPFLNYAQISPRRFDTLYFVLFFFLALFCLERLRPRFWCRYLCPAGGLLALLSLKPLWRRRVRGCNACASCARACPTGAIRPDGIATDHAECITCRTCVDQCPAGGTGFSFQAVPASGRKESEGRAKAHSPANDASLSFPEAAGGPDFLPSRRVFLAAAGAGAGLALAGYSHVHTLLTPDPRGTLWDEANVRPPGALPEQEFLTRCLRCGQCMKVCPTNGLQPVWLTAGVEGMFSPVLTARRGPCEPDCNACGQVCPTGAIAPLPLEQKHWAKVGTAVVIQGYCLAWAENRSCVVCEEVCPYGAIKCEQVAGAKAPVPLVKAERCFGCGYCEQYCPVRVPAIVVRPLGALRLQDGKYRETAQSIGLTLVPASKDPSPEHYPEELPPGALPPGFSE